MAARPDDRLSLSRTTMIKIGISVLLLTIAAYAAVSGMVAWRQSLPPTRAEAFPDGVMHVGVDASYPPFAVDNGSELYGVDIALGRALADEMGVEVQFVNMGYDGLYDSLRATQVDVVISALIIDPSKMRDVRYTRPYYDNGLLLIDEPATDITTMRDVPGYRLAFEYGSGAHSLINTWERRLQTFELRPYELPSHALDALRLDDADAALVNTTTYRLYQREYPDWQSDAHRLRSQLYAIAVPYDRLATYQWVDAALGALQFDGELDAILDEWL